MFFIATKRHNIIPSSTSLSFAFLFFFRSIGVISFTSTLAYFSYTQQFAIMNRLAFSLLFLASTDAFFVTPSSRPSTTVLRAESNDILNSPAFLQRKYEVLQTDLQKAEDALAAAQQRLEEGKAEWGPQLADLQIEVSVCVRKPLCQEGKLTFLSIVSKHSKTHERTKQRWR